MDDLQSLGLTLPTPAYLAGLVVFGIIGYVAFRRGRKTSRRPLVWIGLATMLYPYAVSETWLLWLVGAIACVWITLEWN